MSESSSAAPARVTLRTIRQWVRQGQRFAMLTCYDATTARWLARGGVGTMLVGDSAAQMILGHETTLGAPLDFMVQITAAVRRGAPQALVMADMPFGSYQCGDDQALANAVRFLVEGQADCVKLEVEESFAPLVARMSAAGVPVVAHIGSRPQQVRHQGTVRSVGRTEAEARRIVQNAQTMAAAGADMLLIEAVPAEVSQRIVDLGLSKDQAPLPIIGCGAGPACHGHVVVLHDLLGMSDWHPPFVTPNQQVGAAIEDSARQWVELIASGEYLRTGHPYTMRA